LLNCQTAEQGPPSYLSFKQAIAKLFGIQNSLAAIKDVGYLEVK
jgi:hypothetical protein